MGNNYELDKIDDILNYIQQMQYVTAEQSYSILQKAFYEFDLNKKNKKVYAKYV